MSVSLGSASGSILIEVAQARQNIRALAGDLRGFSSSAGSSFSGASSFITQHEQHIRDLGTGLTGLGAIAAGVFGAGVWNAANVEQAFSIMAAGTGAQGAELDALREKALQLGKDTSFSATEAAAAITELGKAGMPVETILNGAADAVVNLATAGELDLATAASTLTAAMNQYGLSADQATAVTDLLARGAAASTADVIDLASGLTYVGTTAHQLGIPLDDTVTALAALNDQGIRGSMAGTTLNQMLTSLINPSGKAAGAMKELGLQVGGAFSVIDESTGTMKSLPEIIDNVNRATSGLTETERTRYLNMIFGEQGGRAINALLQTETDAAKAAGKSWEDYAKGVHEGNSAADVARAKMDNLKGDVEQLKGGLETLAYTATSAFLPFLREGAQLLDAFISTLIGLPGPLQTVVAGAIGLAGALTLGAGTFLLFLPRIAETVKALRTLRAAYAASQLAQQGVLTSLKGLIAANPVLFGAMAVGAAALLAYKTNFLGFGDAVRSVAGWIRDFIKDFQLQFKLYESFQGVGKLEAAFKALGVVLSNILGFNVQGEFDAIFKSVNRVWQAVRKIGSGFTDMFGALLAGDWNKAFQKLRKTVAGFGDLLSSPAKAIGSLLKGISTGFKPLDDVLHNLGKAWTDFGRLIQEIFQGDFKGALDVSERLLRHFGDYLQSLGELAWIGVKAAVSALIDGFKAIDWTAVASTVLDGAKAAFDLLASAASGLWDWIKDSVGDIDWGAIKDALLSALETAFSGIKAAVSIGFDILENLAENALSKFGQAKDWLIDKVPWLEGPLDAAGETLTGAFNLVMNLAGSLISTLGSAWSSVKRLISSVFGWLGDFFGIGDDGSATAQPPKEASGGFDLSLSISGTLLSTLGSAWSSVKGLIGSIAGWIADFFGIGDDGGVQARALILPIAGYDLAMHLRGSFLSTLGAAWSSVRGLIGSAFGWIADFFGIGDDGGVEARDLILPVAGFDLAMKLGGTFSSTLGAAWSSVSGLIGSVAGWIADFFGIGQDGGIAARDLILPVAGYDLLMKIGGSLVSSLGSAWTSLTGLISSIWGWIVGFFGIGEDGNQSGETKKEATGTISFLLNLLGSIVNGLGEAWGSLTSLISTAGGWIAGFFGIGDDGSGLGGTVEKSASAVLTLGAEFKDSITDSLDSKWDSVKELVGSVGSAAKDLVEDGWNGVTKTVNSAVDIVVEVSGSVKDAIGSGLSALGIGGGGNGGEEAAGGGVTLDQRIDEIATNIETALGNIGTAFSNFDADGKVEELNTKLVTALDGMSGDSIGTAAKSWVERGLAKIGDNLTADSVMGVPRAIDTQVGTAFGAMSGESLSAGMRGWIARAIAVTATQIGQLGNAFAISIDTAAGTGFSSLSGDSLSGAMRAWIARAIAVTATSISSLGQAFAISIDTAAGGGFAAFSGESLSAGMQAWIARAIAVTATMLGDLGMAIARAIDTVAGVGLSGLSGESLSSGLVSWIGRAQALASTTLDMTTLADGMATKLQTSISPKLDEIVVAFQTFAGSVASEMGRLTSQVTAQANAMSSNLRRSATDAQTTMRNAFTQMQSAATTAASRIAAEASRMANSLATSLSSGGSRAVSAISSAMGQVVSAVSSAAGRMYSAGVSVGQAAGDGVAAGMYAALGGVQAAASAIIAEVDRAMRAKAQIASPSKLTTWIGEMLGRGPAVGMLSKLGEVRSAAERLMQAAIPTVDPRALDYGIGSYLDDMMARQLAYTGIANPYGGAPMIGVQNIELNVTQQPGEDGEVFANRVIATLVEAYDGVNGLGV